MNAHIRKVLGAALISMPMITSAASSDPALSGLCRGVSDHPVEYQVVQAPNAAYLFARVHTPNRNDKVAFVPVARGDITVYQLVCASASIGLPAVAEHRLHVAIPGWQVDSHVYVQDAHGLKQLLVWAELPLRW